LLSAVRFIVGGMSSAAFTSAGHPVTAALDAVTGAIDSTVGADVWAISDDDLAEGLVRLEALAARQAELGLRLVREAEARDLARRQGAPSTVAWLRHTLRLRPGQARMRVQLANRCDPPADQAPTDWGANPSSGRSGWSMPATAAALGEGAVSVDHAAVVARTMAAMPTSLDADQLQAAEAALATWARDYDPGEVANLGKSLLHLLDADSLEEKEQRAYERRELHLTDLGDGSTRIRGQLDNESAAVVRAALDPLAAPQPASEETGPDRRSAGQRMADALVELARRALDGGDLPAGHAVRPHVSVIVDLETLLARAAERGIHPGTLEFGGPMSAAVARRLGCDAEITRVITDSEGMPLDVGRARRTVTPAQWAALVVRDAGCAFPGCARPAAWCIAHHIVHWADGGPTDLDNLVLLCDHHHRVVHHHGWDITLAADRRPEFLPPPWIDPTRQPRRNTQPQYHQRAGP
jgi:Domain of unknown function (DUF222)/HNH endonuclease